MNIVLAHASDISKPGGGTQRVSAFASGLEAEGYDVTLVIPKPAESLPRRVQSVQVETVPINHPGVLTQPLRGGSVIRRARKISNDRNAVIQIEHSPLAGIGSLFGCREYVIDMHDLAFPSPLYGDLPLGSLVQQGVKRIERRGIRDARKIVVVSDRMQQLVRETWDIPVDRFVTIPNAYFPEIREKYGNNSPIKGRVAFLGSLHPKLSVETFEKICELPEVSELLVVGDGTNRSQLESIKNPKLRLTGYLPDEEAFELVSRAEVAINPQRVSQLQRASSPVKLYYYSALGVPMVLTEGPDEVTAFDAQGAAISVSENGDFVGAVQDILNSEKRQEAMREASKGIATKSTWDTRVERLIELYETLEQ
jgi:glycosyltransferase involved in cell wall biosynthesis